MIETYIVTLLGLSLIGHTRDAMNEKNMLNQFKTPLIEIVANEHPANTEKKPGGTLSIALSDNHRNWILRYNEPDEAGDGSLLKSQELTKKSVLSPRKGLENLEDYETRIKEQRQALINFVRPEIEQNNKHGSMSTAGFGAAEILFKALYTNANEKWRFDGKSWEAIFRGTIYK
jgi:hypothetical protein